VDSGPQGTARTPTQLGATNFFYPQPPVERPESLRSKSAMPHEPQRRRESASRAGPSDRRTTNAPDSRESSIPAAFGRRRAEDRPTRSSVYSRKLGIVAAALTVVIGAAAVFYLANSRGPRPQSGVVPSTTERANSSQSSSHPDTNASGIKNPVSAPPQQAPAAKQSTPNADRSPSVIPPTEPVSVHFGSNPSGAEVEVDSNNELTCMTPCDLDLRAGGIAFRYLLINTAPNNKSSRFHKRRACSSNSPKSSEVFVLSQCRVKCKFSWTANRVARRPLR
jgi:hypothetical protein